MVVKMLIFHSVDNQAVTSLMFNSLIYSVLTNWGARRKKNFASCSNLKNIITFAPI